MIGVFKFIHHQTHHTQDVFREMSGKYSSLTFIVAPLNAHTKVVYII